MKLKEIFDQLTYGELSQLAIGNSEAGAIDSNNYDRVLAHVNLGLTALYKRFPLKEGRLTVELQTGRTLYPIVSSFAVTGKSKETIRYIKDSLADPFKNDIHKIERVYLDNGTELYLNDESETYSVFTPTATTLRVHRDLVDNPVQFPDELKTRNLVVVYRANHPLLMTDDGDLEPELVEVELPASHLEPLLLFIASRMHTPLGMGAEGNVGNNYFQKYEMACQEIETRNLRVDNVSQTDRLHSRGFV